MYIKYLNIINIKYINIINTKYILWNKKFMHLILDRDPLDAAKTEKLGFIQQPCRMAG